MREGVDDGACSTIAGKFRLERIIGRGATASVHEAVDLSTGQPVALKLLHPHLRADPVVIRRFLREARSALALDHPKIVRILDSGTHEDGTPYLAMELLRGRTLAQALREDGPLPFLRAARIVGDILEAVGEAHARGVLHRDLKPANVILVGTEERVKVCDFGIAKALDSRAPASTHDAPGTTVTGPNEMCGTPEYMSPEQARAESLDARSDVYAVGIILYQLITGEPPFRAPSQVGIISRLLVDAPEPMALRRPDQHVSARLESLVASVLSKKRELRPETALAFREALLRIARLEPEAVRPRDPASLDPAAGALAPTVRARRAPAQSQQRRGVWIALAVGAAAVCGAVLVAPRAQRGSGDVARRAPLAKAVMASVVAADAAPAGPSTAAPPPAALTTARASTVDRRRARKPREAPWLEQAEQLLRDRQTEMACALGERIRDRAPAPPAAFRFLGKCYLRLGRVSEAKEHYRRYLELEPGSPDALFIQGILER
jgi:hypothetical protein